MVKTKKQNTRKHIKKLNIKTARAMCTGYGYPSSGETACNFTGETSGCPSL